MTDKCKRTTRGKSKALTAITDCSRKRSTSLPILPYAPPPIPHDSPIIALDTANAGSPLSSKAAGVGGASGAGSPTDAGARGMEGSGRPHA